MRSATVRDLRYRFSEVAAWIAEGESVDITRGGKLFARLVPAAPTKVRRFRMPDIQARLDRAFGDTSYTTRQIWPEAWPRAEGSRHDGNRDRANPAFRNHPLSRDYSSDIGGEHWDCRRPLIPRRRS